MTNAELKAAIVAAVYENTEGAITGDALQDILLKIVEQYETPLIDFDNLTATSGEGTAADIAELLGVSEDMVNRIADGLVPEIIFKIVEYKETAVLTAPSNTIRQYSKNGRTITLYRIGQSTNIYYSILNY